MPRRNSRQHFLRCSVGADDSVRPLRRTPYPVIANQCAHWCGERTERCRWQMKRGERVAAVKISSAIRKAAQKFWAPQQGHPFFADREALSFSSERKYPKNAAKTHGFGILCAYRREIIGKFPLAQSDIANQTVLSHGRCVYIRLLLPQPTLNGRNRVGVCICRFGEPRGARPTGAMQIGTRHDRKEKLL